MLLKYFLFVCLFYNPVWSYLVLPVSLQRESPLQPETVPNSNNAGEPLILTPYLKSNQTSKARKLSDVEPFFKGVVSNSGYFTVNETHNSNLFFWFFRKTDKNWERAPLVLWLQGGPGCSSLYGLFAENGPLWISKKGLKRRKISWTNDYNVLYIDQPVGSGFSFTNSSNGHISNQQQVADHLYEALTQFFLLYPELKDNPFYVAGESYAGRYVPAIAYKIHTQKVARKSSIDLKGLFLVSATTDGLGMLQHLSDVCYHIGIVDFRVRDELAAMEDQLKYLVNARLWYNASLQRGQILRNVWQNSLVNLYDYTKPVDLFEDADIVKFLQSADTKRRIHAGKGKYAVCSGTVYKNFHEDIMKSVKPWVEELLEHYPVAFVGGQYDVIVAYTLNANLLDKLEWSGAVEFSRASRLKLVDKKEVTGYYKSAGNLKDILIRRAGHMIPKDQPRVSLDVLNKFVNNKL